MAGQAALGVVDQGRRGVVVHREWRDARAVVVRDERPLHVGALAPGDDVGELEDRVQLLGRPADPHRLPAVLERRVEPRHREEGRRRVVGQRRDREDVVVRQLVHEPGDPCDVGGQGAPRDARDGVHHVGGRAAGDHDRRVVGHRPVEPGIARAERELPRHARAVPLDDGAREADVLPARLDLAPVPRKDLASLGVPDEEPDLLEDLERGLVDPADLAVRQECRGCADHRRPPRRGGRAARWPSSLPEPPPEPPRGLGAAAAPAGTGRGDEGLPASAERDQLPPHPLAEPDQRFDDALDPLGVTGE